MSPTTRIILILGLVLLLFAGLLAFELGRDDSDKPTFSGLFEGFHSTFAIDKKLTPSDILGACSSGTVFRVPAGLPCSVLIRSSDVEIRNMALVLRAGSKGRVELNPRGGSGVQINAPIRSKEPASPLKLQVMKGGAQLKLTCEAPPGVGLPCEFAMQ
jgi:hypothetical protein